MFNQTRLQEVLISYKQEFPTRWEDEKFKWEAVKCFQDNWNLNAPDFSNMLKKSIEKTGELLASRGKFPVKVIQELADAAPEEVREMFSALYDENHDVVERILEFKDKSIALHNKYGKKDENHYQDENTISTYLWLRYPDIYYIYKFKEAREVAKELDKDYYMIKGHYIENLRNFYALYDEVCAYLHTDKELTNMMKDHLTESCYEDPEYKTLTIDVGFYLYNLSQQNEIQDEENFESEWSPTDYSPEISTEIWVELLKNPQVFADNSLKIMKRMKDYGGQATCSQLSEKYGEDPNFYKNGSQTLAKRVSKVTGCPKPPKDNENANWWPILYVGKYSDSRDQGIYIWKLRDELFEALNEVDLSKVELYSLPHSDAKQNYWWLCANPNDWKLSNLPVGGIQSYSLYTGEFGKSTKRKNPQSFIEAKVGEMVIGYVTREKQIVSICKVAAEQNGENIFFEKVGDLTSPIDLDELQNYPELKNGAVMHHQGSLFKLTKDEYDFIINLILEKNPQLSVILEYKKTRGDHYTREDFLKKVFMSGDSYDRLVSVLRHKKNIILQGAPGVGKTFAAYRLAYSIMGEKDDDRIGFVQFHQNYSYEDFILGYKPSENGFELKEGVFYKFCKKASSDPDKKDYFFIIDEINRGNMSKIFGELLMLIEKDYRGVSIPLVYEARPFEVPENLYIIGMMNTADRSLALIDYALRRRFSFFDMDPGFESDLFESYKNELNDETFDKLIEAVKKLNKEIEGDSSLGKGFRIGHSYFSNWEKEESQNDRINRMHEVIDFEIIPMLEEYWFDDETEKKLQNWKNKFQEVFQ